jgi:hypothetical protein
MRLAHGSNRYCPLFGRPWFTFKAPTSIGYAAAGYLIIGNHEWRLARLCWGVTEGL